MAGNDFKTKRLTSAFKLLLLISQIIPLSLSQSAKTLNTVNVLGNSGYTGGVTCVAAIDGQQGTQVDTSTTIYITSDPSDSTKTPASKLVLSSTNSAEMTHFDLQCTTQKTPLYPIRTMVSIVDTQSTLFLVDARSTIKLALSYDGSTPTMKVQKVSKSVNLNIVYDLGMNSALVGTSTFSITSVLFGAQPVFVLDKLFALREYSLNDVLFSNFIFHHVWIDVNGKRKQYQVDPLLMPFSQFPKSTFTDNSSELCQILSYPSGGPGKIYFSQYLVNQYWVISSTVWEFQPKALISSVFLQFGQSNTQFILVIQETGWNAATKLWYNADKDYQLATSGATGNYLHNFNNDAGLLVPNEPVGLTYFDIRYPGPDTKVQLCTIQYFGWYFCQTDSIVVSPSELWFESGQATTTYTIIGLPKVYYDPDLKRVNNRFCYLGQKQDITWSGGAQSGTLVYGTDLLIEPETFQLTMQLKIAGAATSIGYSDDIKFTMPRDTRETKMLSNPFVFTVKAYFGCCTTALLQKTTVTLKDNTSIANSVIKYYVGSGLIKIQLISSNVCYGFASSTFSISEDVSQTTLQKDYSTFQKCVTTNSNEQMCVYIDQSSGLLSIFSNQNLVFGTDLFYSYTITATHFATVALQQISGVGGSDKIIIQAIDPFCSETKFTPALIKSASESDQLFIYNLDVALVTKSQQVISFSNDTPSGFDCGEITFQLVAKESNSNFVMAQQLLSCSENSCIQIKEIQDVSQLQIDVTVTDEQFAGQTFVFELQLGFLSYGISDNNKFEIQVSVAQLYVAPVIFYSILQDIKYSYFIGLANKPIQLRDKFVVQDGYFITYVDATQTEGNLPLEFYAINNSTLMLEIYVTDPSFDGTTSEFQICAYLLNGQSNCSLSVTVEFLCASEAQIQSSNTAPTFISYPEVPDPIPCVESNAALAWSYSFPKAVDKELQQISQAIQCHNVTTAPFKTELLNDILTLRLQTSSAQSPTDLNLDCDVTLKDKIGAKTQYKLTFINTCTKTPATVVKNVTSHFEKPVPKIQKINSQGQIKIEWNVAMIVPENQITRRLAETADECLSIQLQPGQEPVSIAQSRLNFTYSFQMQPNSTIITLKFGTPALVSTLKYPDQVIIYFKTSSCFKSVQGLEIEHKFNLTIKLPRQRSGEGTFSMPYSVQESVKVVTTCFTFFLLLNFFLQGFLNTILSSVASLGIIFHMFLVTLNYPVEMMEFFGILFPLLSFDALPVGPLYEKIFHFEQITTDQALTDQFDGFGYSSLFIVNNIGSLFFIAVLQLIHSVIVCLLRRFKPFKGSYAQNKIDSHADQILWNDLIQFYSSNYLMLSLVSFIGSKNPRFGSNFSKTENFCSVLAVSGAVVSVVFPIIIGISYFIHFRNNVDPEKDRVDKIISILADIKKSKKVKKQIAGDLFQGDNLLLTLLQSDKHKSFMETYGSLLEGLRVRHLGLTLTVLTPIISLILEFLVAASVTWLIDWPVFTIFAFNFAILFCMEFFIYFQPYDDKIEQGRLVFNSITYLALNYHLFLFTDFTDYSIYPLIANSVVSLIWLNIGINLLVTGAVMFSSAVNKFKHFFQRLKYRQKQAERAKNLLKKLHKQALKQEQTNTAQLKQVISSVKQKKKAPVDKLVPISECSEYSSEIEEVPRTKISSRTNNIKSIPSTLNQKHKNPQVQSQQTSRTPSIKAAFEIIQSQDQKSLQKMFNHQDGPV